MTSFLRKSKIRQKCMNIKINGIESRKMHVFVLPSTPTLLTPVWNWSMQSSISELSDFRRKVEDMSDITYPARARVGRTQSVINNEQKNGCVVLLLCSEMCHYNGGGSHRQRFDKALIRSRTSQARILLARFYQGLIMKKFMYWIWLVFCFSFRMITYPHRLVDWMSDA